MNDDTFIRSFRDLYLKYGITCLHCSTLHDVNWADVIPPEQGQGPLQEHNMYRALRDCPACLYTVQQQWDYWDEHVMYNQVYVFPNAENVLGIMFLGFVGYNKLGFLKKVIPKDFLCFKLSPEAFQQYMGITYEEGKRECFQKMESFCDAIMLLPIATETEKDTAFFIKFNLTLLIFPVEGDGVANVSELQELLPSNTCTLLQGNPAMEPCSICYEEFGEGGNTPLQINQCQHVFHNQCLLTWLNLNRTCPLCRTAL